MSLREVAEVGEGFGGVSCLQVGDAEIVGDIIAKIAGMKFGAA